MYFCIFASSYLGIRIVNVACVGIIPAKSAHAGPRFPKLMRVFLSVNDEPAYEVGSVLHFVLSVSVVDSEVHYC